MPSGKGPFDEAVQKENAQEYSKALVSYQTIVDNYPKSENRYKALFMIGYVNSDFIKDYKKAQKAFDQLIAEYPDCDLADDAKILRDAAASGKDLITVLQDTMNATSR